MRVTTKLNKARHKVRNGGQIPSKTKLFWSRVSGKFPVKKTGLSGKRVSASGRLENKYTTK